MSSTLTPSLAPSQPLVRLSSARRARSLLLAALFVALAGSTRAAAEPSDGLAALDPGDPHVVYRVGVSEDFLAFAFTMEIHNPPQRELALVVPHWAPGAYRQITVGVRSGEVSADQMRMLGAAGQDLAGKESELALRPDGPRRWLVDARGQDLVRVRYANTNPGRQPNNRSYLTQKGGLVDGPRNFLYAEGLKHAPVHVHFDLPEGWAVATGLEPTFDPTVFSAPDFDRVADCPSLVGRFEQWSFHVKGVPHRVVVATDGEEIRFDPQEFVGMVEAIVRHYVAMFDDLPYRHYTFIYTSGGGGGLEHLSSTTISGSNARRLRARFLQGVTAHEFFHVWNVKRLRPLALGPFDYTGPVPVNDLWISEGLTSFYTQLGLWRAGLYDDAGWRNAVRRSVGRYAGNVWSRMQSPQESSRGVWERGGTKVSYYLSGEVLGLAIDLAIREGSDNHHSLDDVMRDLYERHGGFYRGGPGKPGFRSEDWPTAIRRVTKVDLSDFFAHHIRDAQPVDWARWLAVAGLDLQVEQVPVAGLNPSVLEGAEDDSDVVARARAGLGGEQGLRAGDLILSVGGREVRNLRRLRNRLARATPGEALGLVVRRGEEEVKLELELPARSVLSYVQGAGEADGFRVSKVPRGTKTYDEGVLRDGDLVLRVDGETVRSREAFVAAVGYAADGRARELRIRRAGPDGEPSERTVMLIPETWLSTRVTGLEVLPEPTAMQAAILRDLKAMRTSGPPR